MDAEAAGVPLNRADLTGHAATLEAMPQSTEEFLNTLGVDKKHYLLALRLDLEKATLLHKYLTKENFKTGLAWVSFVDSAIANGWTPHKLLCRMGNYCINNREVGSQEAVNTCMAIPICRFTVEFVSIVVGEAHERRRVLKDKQVQERMLEESTNVFKPSMQDEYARRAQWSMCAWQMHFAHTPSGRGTYQLYTAWM
eukprot:scaffold91277_cov35-Tisochrysis_lutea.AAC.2